MLMDEINSGKSEVVEALILIDLLSLVASRTLRELFIEIIDERQRDESDGSDGEKRSVGEVIGFWAESLRLGYEPPSLVKSSLNDALDPNARRVLLLDRARHEPFGADLA